MIAMKKLNHNINTKDLWNNRYLGDKWRVFPYERVYELYLNKRKDLKHIVDYGCGLGEGIDYLSKKMGGKFSGVDFSDIAIKKARKLYPHHTFEIINLNEEFEPILADMSIIVQTLEHINYPLKVIKKLIKVGEVLISIPNEKEPGGEHYSTFEISDFNIFSVNEVIIGGDIIIITMGEKK